MIRVNLLPVKEAERALGRRQLLRLAGLSAFLAILIMGWDWVIRVLKWLI